MARPHGSAFCGRGGADSKFSAVIRSRAPSRVRAVPCQEHDCCKAVACKRGLTADSGACCVG